MATRAQIPKIAAGPSRHVYDVIVFGGQLGGALAAAILAKHQYRVLLIEHDGLGPGYERDGFQLPYAPFVMPPLKALPTLEQPFSELGITTQLQRSIKPHVPELQLILRDHRVDLHQDEARRMADLRREFGEQAGAMNDALKALGSFHEHSDPFFREQPELPAEGLMESWALKGKLKKLPGVAAPLPAVAQERPASVLSELLPFLTYLDAPALPLAQGRALSQTLAQPSRFPNGREGFRELLSKRLTELGGELIQQGTSTSSGFIIEELQFDGDRLDGIKLLQNDNIYRAHAFIAATDSGALRRLISDKKRHRKLVEQLDLSTTKRFMFTVNWVVRADLLPRGMGELLLLDGIDDLGPILIQTHLARRVGKGDDDSLRVVCAGAFVPSSTRDLGEEHLRTIADRLHARLDDLMPFSKQHALSISAPYLDASGVRGSRLLPHPLFGFPESESLLGVEGLGQRTASKNLFLASREVLPGLGIEGELMAGARAARLVQEVVRKLNPLR